ncbi:hypothetical protein EDB85DRAFT_2141626 [Lactarius pseudohatsudake]|nr:hypothetical protein EDB85DRAFT_2141626 [Lactarius pseudohatsudake]
MPCLFWRGLDGATLITLIVKATGRFNYAKTGKEKGVDEKAGICITTHTSGGISVIHLFSSIVLWCLPRLYVRPFSHCEYDNGYLVFDRMNEEKEVWRPASDFSAEGEVATHSPPDVEQMDASACAVTVYHQYAPRGQFRPWAVLALPSFTIMYRLAYPTLIFANSRHAFLYDLRTGSLVQTIDIHLQICYVDVNERYVFVCEPHAVHVFSRERQRGPGNTGGRHHTAYSARDQSRARFAAAHVSGDGRDLVVLSSHKRRVVFIQDFERICRGETSLERGGLSLSIRSKDVCCYLGFEHGRVCVATMQGLYIFTFGPDLSAKAVFVRPSNNVSASSHAISCVQLTDRHIYFTWDDARRRQDIPLFEDTENARELLPPIAPTLDRESQVPPLDPIESVSVGCIDFTLMPKAQGLREKDSKRGSITGIVIPPTPAVRESGPATPLTRDGEGQ